MLFAGHLRYRWIHGKHRLGNKESQQKWKESNPVNTAEDHLACVWTIMPIEETARNHQPEAFQVGCQVEEHNQWWWFLQTFSAHVVHLVIFQSRSQCPLIYYVSATTSISKKVLGLQRFKILPMFVFSWCVLQHNDASWTWTFLSCDTLLWKTWCKILFCEKFEAHLKKSVP